MLTRVHRDDDEGFALLAVLGGMLALTGVVLATLVYVVSSLPGSRQGQDSAGAVQAAQAGVDDYLARLATCDSYWQGRCGRPPSPGEAGWADVAGSSQAQYHVELVSTPASGGAAGILRLRSTGRINVAGRDAKRTLVVDLKKRSLLDYIYYTDKESLAPDTVVALFPARTERVDPAQNDVNARRFAGVSPTEADKCGRYHYATTTVPGRARPIESFEESKDGGKTWGSTQTRTVDCDIQFAPIDTIEGPLYTQDAILLNNPLFKGPVSTRWPAGSTPAPNTSAWYRTVLGGSGPKPGSQVPKFDDEDVKLPPSNDKIKDRTDPLIGDGIKGCRYTGRTRIVLKPNATMDVTSPLTRSTNPGCTTGSTSSPGLGTTQNLPLPQNGVIYVASSTEACSPGSLGYPVAGDVTTYQCADGDVFIEGTLSGRLTVATEHDVIVTEDLLYRDAALDSLGLIANGDVQVYHPVRCSTTVVAPFACTSFTNISSTLQDVTINAAVLSVKQSFTVQNFNRGQKLGTLLVSGGIYQKHRGAVGTGGTGGTGYAKDYRYDARLKSLPPPSFLDPVAAPWKPVGSAEVRNPTGLPA